MSSYDSIKDSKGFRIPSLMHVISSCDNEDEIPYLYLTFDENLDLWQKIGESSDVDPQFLEVVGQHVYLFDMRVNSDRRVAKFDLLSREWVPMQRFRYKYTHYCVTHIEDYLYVVGEIFLDINNRRCIVEVYDTANDTWFDGPLLFEIYQAISVTLDKKIYVVGNTLDDERMTMHGLDPATQQASQLSPPNEYRTHSAIVTYRKTIYLIGGIRMHEEVSKAEEYNAETDTWEYLPDLPFTYTLIKAIVINDRLIVYDDYESENMKNVCWNDAAGEWEKLDPTCGLRNFHKHLFATVEDVDTLRSIKEDRNQTDYEKSPFN